MLRSLFRKPPPTAPAPRVPDDVRVYAIGDVHGRADLLEQLLAKIAADHAARPAKRQIIVLLGDLIDRGPDSAGVVAQAMAIDASSIESHVIAGNHEELLLLTLDGDLDAARVFSRAGGRETLLSYGLPHEIYERADLADLIDMAGQYLPPDHVAFIRRLEDIVEIGDYAFVHAGIRPGVPLAEQQTSHLRWIRGEFLTHRNPHPRFIIHGHTITDTVDEQPNRIGIDTGAFASNRLTAIALDGDLRWFIETS